MFQQVFMRVALSFHRMAVKLLGINPMVNQYSSVDAVFVDSCFINTRIKVKKHGVTQKRQFRREELLRVSLIQVKLKVKEQYP